MPVILYKNRLETPLQALDGLRLAKPELGAEKLSYAGRLDPMAEGVMVVLVGEENKDREKFLGLPKTYRTEIICSLTTDTGDLLGKVISIDSRMSKEEVKKMLPKHIGKFEQPYPAFSSKSFAAAGSFEKVQEGDFVEKLSHIVEVYSIDLVAMKEISAKELLEKVRAEIPQVQGDFRQTEIIARYKEVLGNADVTFPVMELRLSVSSGFYVRQFATDFGCAFSIIREKVGDWTVDKGEVKIL